MGKRQYGGLPKRCVYLRNTAGDGELPILQWINIDEVSVHSNNKWITFLLSRETQDGGSLGEQEMLWEHNIIMNM